MDTKNALKHNSGQITDLPCAHEWIKSNENRKNTLLLIKLPLTATQISLKLNLKPYICGNILKDFTIRHITHCLNSNAKSNKLYYLTPLGKQLQKHLCQEFQKDINDYTLPDTDWDLYGWLCFNHRSSIANIITEPMQPSEIKRLLRHRNPNLRINANNIRDIIKLFEKRDIVEKVKIKKKIHPRYKLTKKGKQLQELLLKQKNCN
ncbi:MAG: hypothetical protein JEZ07_17400 [Phycisphaerae bacterium]|nr:hypothetical protein [Phycisphaerae bacterium]